ncbi:ABC transporter substrate-binding protein [Verrucomicrobiota bacterium sgz303538]
MRIICLSAESADICARLGAWDDVVAVTTYAPQSGLERRPIVSGFSIADADRIAAFTPDLVITFSDVQAEIAAKLVRVGLTVLATNQRTLGEIVRTIRLIGGAIGRTGEAEKVAVQFQRELDALRTVRKVRPQVYFEEWPEPLISGIGWVSELIELTGGDDVFRHRCSKGAKAREVTVDEIAATDPEISVGSWCGKPVNIEEIAARPGFGCIAAVCSRQIHALDSDIILQPGPRLLDGARALKQIFDAWEDRAAYQRLVFAER